MNMFAPAHPGLILREYMGEERSVSQFAEELGMTRANLSMILNGRLGISAAVALRLARVFKNTDAEFWLNLQNQFDLASLRQKTSPAKSRSAEFQKVTLYLRADTHRDAKRKWEDAKEGDFSDLVQHLLSDYVAASR